MSYEQLYLRMKALEKERDELRAFIDDKCYVMNSEYDVFDAACAHQYEEIEHVV